MTAYDYPLLGLFWTMLFLSFWVGLLLLLYRLFADILRSKDLGGWAKALWVILVVIVPFLGGVAYLIVRGHLIREREMEETQRAGQAHRDAVAAARQSARGAADELSRLTDLKERGVISDAEFDQQKSKLLS